MSQLMGEARRDVGLYLLRCHRGAAGQHSSGLVRAAIWSEVAAAVGAEHAVVDGDEGCLLLAGELGVGADRGGDRLGVRASGAWVLRVELAGLGEQGLRGDGEGRRDDL